MWSQENKEGLLEHLPAVILFDSYGSSEAVGLGVQRLDRRTTPSETAQFKLGERVKVFTEDGRAGRAGSDESGIVAIGGRIPLGYYKDEEKTAHDVPHHRRRALLACPATSPRSTPTARSTCSAAARCASTPAARRSSPRRSRRC